MIPSKSFRQSDKSVFLISQFPLSPSQEAIASHALEGTLSGQNVTAVLEILTALSNSSGLTQTRALNHIMEELLQQLGKEENLHLVSEPTGRVMMIMTGTQNNHTLYIFNAVIFWTDPARIKGENESGVFIGCVRKKHT